MAGRIVSSVTMPTKRDIMETHGVNLVAGVPMNSRLSTGLLVGDIYSSLLCWVLVTLKDQPLYVDAAGDYVKSTRYAIGPSKGRKYIDNGRETVDFDRGPCRIVIYTKMLLN